MNLLIKQNDFEHKLLFAYGFIGTMPILQIGAFTAFTLMTLAVMLYTLISEKGKININRKTWMFILITGLMLISSAVCVTSEMEAMWKSLQIKNSIWQICYLLLFFYYCHPNRYTRCSYYIRGVYCAALFQMLWGLLQLVIYEAFTVSINKLIFFDFLHIEDAKHIQTRGDSIALTGLCWNAGNIAPLLVIGYVFSKSAILKLGCVGYSLICGSRTATVGVIACVVMDVVFLLKKKIIRTKYKNLLFAGVGTVAVIVFLCLQEDILLIIVNKVMDMINSFSITHLMTQSSARIHMRYWITIPEVTDWAKTIHLLFGFGNACSGYPFVQLYNQYADRSWVVECDYVNVLWNYGYIGFFAWYIWYAYKVWCARKIDNRFWVLFAGILAEGVTYNVTFNWCYVMILFLIIQISYGFNIFEHFERGRVS